MPRLAVSISGTSISNRFPELASIPAELLRQAATVAIRIDSTRYENTIHLAAHLASIWNAENSAEPDGGSGVVQSESTGPFSKTYSTGGHNTSDMRDFMKRTSYGRTYLALSDSNPRRILPFVV